MDISKQLTGVLEEPTSGPDDWRFLAAETCQIDRFNMKRLEAVFDACGITQFSSTPRHTLASLNIQNGGNLRYVCDQLGHSTIQVFADIYGHFDCWTEIAPQLIVSKISGTHLVQ